MNIRTLLIIAFSLIVSSSYAQPQQPMSRAYLCRTGTGPTILVKPEDLVDAQGAICHSIEYRAANAIPVKRCKNEDGAVVYTSHNPFATGRGCREIEEGKR